MRDALREAWRDALAALDLRARTRDALPPPPPASSRVVVLALGKSAAPMLAGVASRWPGRVARAVVARPARALAVDAAARAALGDALSEHAAGHPLPDAASVAAGSALRDAARSLRPGDLALVLLSGGASAAACLPAAGLSLDDARDATRALLHAGLPIETLNAVRGRLDALKHGGLAAMLARADALTLASLDVLGDDATALRTLGSAPTITDPAAPEDLPGWADALALLSPRVRALATTPSPRGPSASRCVVIARPSDAREATARALAARGFAVQDLPDARDSVEALAARYAAVVRSLAPGEARVAVGEPTVALPERPGCGGRAGRLALLVARAIAGDAGACFLACGTDGVDGESGAAGAVVDGGTWAGGGDEALSGYDDGVFHARAGSAVVTGPTGINLLDVHAMARVR